MSEYNSYLREDFKEYTPFGISMYEYMYNRAKDFGDLPALSFYGTKSSYKEMFEKIEEAERALRGMGIKNGDIVAVSLPGMPEAVHLIYAINKIGAIYCAFDCRSQECEILETLEKFDPKLCIIPSFQLGAFKNVHDHAVVYIDPTHSIGGPTKITSFIANIWTGRIFIQRKNKNLLSYDEFLKKAADGENLPPEKNADNIFGCFYTSGTTYGRKSIILTNENVNSAAYQYAITENYVQKGEAMLDIMPMFTCYGVTIAMHLPLSLGVHVKLIPLINIKKLKQTIMREKPNFLITVPAHWEYFVKENFDGCDLSYLRTVIVGGDKIDPEYEDKITEIFHKCGSDAWIRCGYGLSETTSVGVLPAKGTPKGSVGKPMVHTLIGIFDRDTWEPMPRGEKGEICIYGPTVCNGYFKDEEMTEMLLKKHDDGRVWAHTGDVGYIDEDGYLFFCERLKRMYVRYDGTKISPFSIEQILSGCKPIARCMVTAIRDKDHSHGMCARALIVLREGEDKKSARAEIDKYIHENLGQHMVPKEIMFVEKLPYTKMGKLDYFAAAQMENTEEK